MKGVRKMKKICKLVANVNEVEICEMPNVRIIGKEIKCSGAEKNTYPALLWDKCINDGTLETLSKLPKEIPNTIIGWSGDFDPEDESYFYIIGVMTPADTPVPTGFQFRDLLSSLVAKGIYDTGYAMIDVYTKMGYTQNYEPCGWNGELYFKDDPDPSKWSNISPIKLT